MSYPSVLRCRNKSLILDQAQIMGVMNITSDSFYRGSRFSDVDDAVQKAKEMVRDGAAIVDIGAMSSRPGADIIPSQSEIELLMPIIRRIKEEVDCIISVDTWNSDTARNALEAGAHMINDISGGQRDKAMFRVVAEFNAGYVLMHMRGTPKTMASLNAYPQGLVFEVLKELKSQVLEAEKADVANIVIDPGFGFSKSSDQNFEMLRQLSAFHILGHPVLVGISRKSMIWKTLKITPDEALNGTTALHAWALSHRPQIIRTHDVAPLKEVISLNKAFQIENDSKE